MQKPLKLKTKITEPGFVALSLNKTGTNFCKILQASSSLRARRCARRRVRRRVHWRIRQRVRQRVRQHVRRHVRRRCTMVTKLKPKTRLPGATKVRFGWNVYSPQGLGCLSN